MFDLEDKDGMMRCIIWPDQFVNYGEFVQPDAILAVRGSIDKRPGSEEANMIVNEIIPLDALEARYTRGLKIRIIEEHHGQKGLEQLHEILRGYPGSCGIELVLCLADGTRVPCRCEKTRVAINPEMRGRIDELLGKGNCIPVTKPAVSANASRGNGNGGRRGGNGRGK